MANNQEGTKASLPWPAWWIHSRGVSSVDFLGRLTQRAEPRMTEDKSLALKSNGDCWAGFPSCCDPVVYFIFYFSPSWAGISLTIILCLSHRCLLGEDDLCLWYRRTTRGGESFPRSCTSWMTPDLDAADFRPLGRPLGLGDDAVLGWDPRMGWTYVGWMWIFGAQREDYGRPNNVPPKMFMS